MIVVNGFYIIPSNDNCPVKGVVHHVDIARVVRNEIRPERRDQERVAAFRYEPLVRPARQETHEPVCADVDVILGDVVKREVEGQVK